MTLFAQYVRQAKQASRAPVALTSEDPLAPLPEGDVAEDVVEEPVVEPVVEEPVVEDVPVEVPVEEPIVTDDVAVVDEPVIEEPVVEEPLVEPVPEVTEEPVVEDVPVEEPAPVVDTFAQARQALEQKQHNLIRNRSQIVAEEPAPVVEPTVEEEPVAEEPVAEPVVEEPVVEDVPVEAPVEAVPADEELPDEPVLDVTAEGDVVEEPVVDDVAAEPVIEEPEVVPAVFEDEDFEEEPVVDEEAPAEDPVGDIETDAAEIEALAVEMEMLSGSMIAIESYGMNPTAGHILQTFGLFDGTALQTLGLEAFGHDTSPGTAEADMALEALGDKVKETAAKWAAKIVSVSSTISDKILTTISNVWTRVEAAGSKLAAAGWDKVKAGAAVVKAHPYQTVIAIIGAIAAVGGVCLFAGKGLPTVSAKSQQITAYVKDIVSKINAIKWPFGSISAKIAEGGAKFTTTVQSGATAAKGVAASSLDWTATMVKSANGQLGRAWTQVKAGAAAAGARVKMVGGTVKSGAKFLKDGVGATSLIVSAKAAKVTGSVKAGAAVASVYGMLAVNTIISTATSLVKLLYSVVAKGLAAIASTFSALVSAAGKAPVAA